MSQRATLEVAPRQEAGAGAIKRLRTAGHVPAVIYGKHYPNENVSVDAKKLRDLLIHSTSENILVDLKVGGKTQLALIQDVQHNPINDQVTHIDFHAVKEDETIHARIPVELLGECVGVKLGGQLRHHIHSLDIKCLPKDLPEKISIDISTLDVGQSLHVGDIPFAKGVSPRRLGAAVVIAMIEEPEAVPETPAAAPAKGKK
jgi:large subunit ribosomal protein L25